jgi:glycine cleavage system H protein
VERNEAIEADPSLLNTDPFGAGWIFKIRLANPADLESLQDATAYRAQIGG